MYQLRAANERGHTQIDWLNSFHTFSFGQYYDPNFMGFSVLRVINDDVVAPDGGFSTHPHDNMEIISIVLSGSLEHKDSLGTGSVIKPGDIQKMTAGSGIMHSEYNPSSQEPVHFLQIWILPDEVDLEPSYQQKHFAKQDQLNKLCLVVSPAGEDNSLTIHQDMKLYQCLIEEEKTVSFKIDSGRRYWIQVAAGSLTINDNILVAGDGVAIVDEENTLDFRGVDPLSNFILFDLP